MKKYTKVEAEFILERLRRRKMKCVNCNSILLSLYYRETLKDKRRTLKTTNYRYCKKCNKIIN